VQCTLVIQRNEKGARRQHKYRLCFYSLLGSARTRSPVANPSLAALSAGLPAWSALPIPARADSIRPQYRANQQRISSTASSYRIVFESAYIRAPPQPPAHPLAQRNPPNSEIRPVQRSTGTRTLALGAFIQIYIPVSLTHTNYYSLATPLSNHSKPTSLWIYV